MKLSALLVLVMGLAVAAMACSSSKPLTPHDAGGRGTGGAGSTASGGTAGTAAGGSTAGATGAAGSDAASGGAAGVDAGAAGSAGSTAVTDAATDPVTNAALCPSATTTDAAARPDGSMTCADMFMLQTTAMPAGTMGNAFGTCGGHRVWLNFTPQGKTLCIYDTTGTETLVGEVHLAGSTGSCSGAGATIPAECGDLSTYAPPQDASPEAAPELDGPLEAAPVPTIEATLKNGLVALWSFDGDGKDRSGHGLDLTVSAGLSYVAGRYGSGLKFVGDTAKIASRPMSDPALQITRSNFTVSLWVSLDPDRQVQQGFLDNGATSGWSVGTPTPGLQWIVQSNGGSVVGGSALQEGFGWRHVVVERSAGMITLYGSGLQLGSSQALDPGVDSTETFRVGTWFRGTALPMFGVVDDVAIWNRALTDAERTYLGSHAAPTP